MKANSIAQGIASAEVIAAEVLRQQQVHRSMQIGTAASRENWMQHTVEADIVRDVGLAYIEVDGGRNVKSFSPSVVITVMELQPRSPSTPSRG